MWNAEWIERLSRREVVTRDRTCPSIPHSAFRIPHWLYLPIREQHSTAWMGLGIALVGHPEVGPADAIAAGQDRKSTRLNSSHTVISYAVFCLKKKTKKQR